MTLELPPTLVLWDIDHTLINTGEFGRTLYETAFLRITGRPMRMLAEMTGRTEHAVLSDTLALHHIIADDVMLQAFYEALADAVNAERGEIRGWGRALPGAAKSLATLAAKCALQSVVTGNIKAIAIAKLEAFDLADHLDFEIGAYGSDGRDRSLLVQAAWQRANLKYELDIPADRVYVIGDTPHDIMSAHEVGVQSIGVASGKSDMKSLWRCQPNVVLPDLMDISALCMAVFGQGSCS